MDLLSWREWDGFSWSVIPSRYPPPRQDMALTYDSARKRVVLFGGIRYAPKSESVEAIFDDTWEYDPQLQLWTEVNVVPAPTLHPAAAYDEARQRSVVLTNDGTETWLWDGFSWGRALPRTTDHPPAVSLAMAYDPVRKQVVTFGGHAPGNPASLLGDTWVWDGSDWKKVSGLASTPQPRHGHRMAWHPGRQALVMAGGVGQNSTWEWNGSSWTETVPQPLPADLGVGHMSTDFTKNTVIFAGGDTCNTLRYVHDGASASWEIVASCGAKLDFTASAADPFRQKIIHHARQQTSQWDGAAWAPLGGSVPPAQARFAMTFDSSQNRAFLFLGQDGSPESPGSLRNDVWAFQVTLSGCTSSPECPEGLACQEGTCVLPGQGAGGQGGAAGASGSSGQAGEGGAGVGGAAGAGAEGGAGGASGTSGQAGAGGEGGGGALPSSGGLFGVDAPDGAGSCGCEVAGRGGRGGAWWWGLGLALLRGRRARRSLAGAEFTEG
ncbi:MAG: hypothetical protein MUF64_07465 [Polyangiaceae bacterium]|nr:hypothetical protein [Polyangiaceae bacterium]